MTTAFRTALTVLIGAVFSLSVAHASAPTVTVTLTGPDEGWYNEDLTFNASGDYTLDAETQQEITDGEAGVSDEYIWSYSPGQLIAGGGPQDTYITVRYSQEQAGATYTVSVTYRVTVTYADDTSDAGSSSASKDVFIKKLEVKDGGGGGGGSTVCAGGVQSTPHQHLFSAKVTGREGSPLSGETVVFDVSTDPADYPASVSPTQAVTNAEGIAETTLTSSRRIGAEATVTATCEGEECELSPTLTMAKPDDDWAVEPEWVVADGSSTATVIIYLTHGDDYVDGHSIRWRIHQIYDAEGQLVYDVTVPLGSKDGYGDVSEGPTTTNAYGQAWTTYTAGTEPGTIVFAALDDTMVENSPGQFISNPNGEALAVKVFPKEIKALYDVAIVDVGDTLFAMHYEDGQPVYDVEGGVPICDVRSQTFRLHNTIGIYPQGASAQPEWRQTWTIKHDGAYVSSHSHPPEPGVWDSSNPGEHTVTCSGTVAVNELLIEMGVRAPGAQGGAMVGEEAVSCPLYQLLNAPLCPQDEITLEHVDEVCTWADGSTTSLECANAVHATISSKWISNNCICNSGTFQDLWDSAKWVIHNGQCCCRAKGMICMLQVLGIPYMQGYVNSAPEPGVRRTLPPQTFCPKEGLDGLDVYWIGWDQGCWNNYQGVCGPGPGGTWFSVQGEHGFKGTYNAVYQQCFPHGFEWVTMTGRTAETYEEALAEGAICSQNQPREGHPAPYE